MKLIDIVDLTFLNMPPLRPHDILQHIKLLCICICYSGFLRVDSIVCTSGILFPQVLNGLRS